MRRATLIALIATASLSDNGAIGLGKISPKVPRAILGRLERLSRLIAAGRIRVPTRLSRT